VAAESDGTREGRERVLVLVLGFNANAKVGKVGTENDGS